MAATAQESEATASRRRRNDWTAEDPGSAQTAPFERRADSAAADRQIRTSALAAKSPHLLVALEAERSKLGMPTGYVPQNGPTGEKPHLEHPQAAAPAPAPEPVAPVALASVVDLRPVVEPPAPVPTAASAPEPSVPEPSMVLPEPATVTVVQMTIPDLLRELASLHRDAILTDEEFSAKKAELLARL